MQRNLRKIQGNLEEVQEDLECTKDTRGDSERSRRHTWMTRRYRKIWKKGEHGNIENEPKKTQEDLT
jgi:hypothetical protein